MNTLQEPNSLRELRETIYGREPIRMAPIYESQFSNYEDIDFIENNVVSEPDGISNRSEKEAQIIVNDTLEDILSEAFEALGLVDTENEGEIISRDIIEDLLEKIFESNDNGDIHQHLKTLIVDLLDIVVK